MGSERVVLVQTPTVASSPVAHSLDRLDRRKTRHDHFTVAMPLCNLTQATVALGCLAHFDVLCQY